MRFTQVRLGFAASCLCLGLAGAASAQSQRPFDPTSNDLHLDYFFQETEQGIVAADVHGTYVFDDFRAYVQSQFFSGISYVQVRKSIPAVQSFQRIEKALEEGVVFAEGLQPARIDVDGHGHAR